MSVGFPCIIFTIEAFKARVKQFYWKYFCKSDVYFPFTNVFLLKLINLRRSCRNYHRRRKV